MTSEAGIAAERDTSTGLDRNEVAVRLRGLHKRYGTIEALPISISRFIREEFSV
jgi:hypothetical protein